MNAPILFAGTAYLATPYARYPGGIHNAYVDACKIAGKLIVAGLKVYSPIAHCHAIAIYANLDPTSHDIWLSFDEAMMEKCDALVVARLPTWEISKGIQHEIQVFAGWHKPIFDLDPETLTMTRRG